MDLLNRYFALQQQIYDYFGYAPGGPLLPLEDNTEYYWTIDDDIVQFGESSVSSEWQYDYVGLPGMLKGGWIYPGDEFTLLVVDTEVSGNKVLAIFDNAKQLI